METGNRKILVYQPVYVWLGVAVSVALLVTAAYVLFERGKSYAATRLEKLARQRSELQQRVAEVQKANLSLREQAAVSQRSSEIDRRASLEVRREFASLQDELLELRQELDFYRGIVSPGDATPGLRIQRFQLEPTTESGRIFYTLTLIQVKRNERYVRGVIEIEVEGQEDGNPKVLLFKKLAEGNSKALNYRFRYFQNFEGEIWIPPQFKPNKVRILLKPQGKGQLPGIEEVMDWPA
jgi:heme exporter protein D